MSAWRLPKLSQFYDFMKGFVKIQSKSCIFAFSLVGMLGITQFVELPFLFRYDWLFLLCLLVQWLLVRFGLETLKDALVVAVFHVLGVGLELYKVNQGSWLYPGESVLAIGPVPLFAGFMYGSVASYMCLAWREHNLRATHWPDLTMTLPFAVVIYAQFFFNGWPVVIRLFMLAVTIWMFRKSVVHFDCIAERWKVPMPVAFVLIGSMIYFAENIATYLGAWSYTDQIHSWTVVHPSKLVSWILLMTVSLIIVAEYKRRIKLLNHLCRK